MEKDFSPATLQSIQQGSKWLIDTNRRVLGVHSHSQVGCVYDPGYRVPDPIQDQGRSDWDDWIQCGRGKDDPRFVCCLYDICSVVCVGRAAKEGVIQCVCVNGRAYVIGWCAELLQGAFLIADDIMDESETRRGKPSWYRVKRVGFFLCDEVGWNDEHQRFLYPSNTHLHSDTEGDNGLPSSVIPPYSLWEDQIQNGSGSDAWLEHGQSGRPFTELSVGLRLGIHYRYFSFQYYNEIITNKTAYYTIFMPIYLGLVLSECDESLLKSPVLADLCLQLGRFFQIRDDYLDVFADPSVLKKVGELSLFNCRREQTSKKESVHGLCWLCFQCVRRRIAMCWSRTMERTTESVLTEWRPWWTPTMSIRPIMPVKLKPFKLSIPLSVQSQTSALFPSFNCYPISCSKDSPSVYNKHTTSTNLLVWDHTKGWFSVASTHPIAFLHTILFSSFAHSTRREDVFSCTRRYHRKHTYTYIRVIIRSACKESDIGLAPPNNEQPLHLDTNIHVHKNAMNHRVSRLDCVHYEHSSNTTYQRAITRIKNDLHREPQSSTPLITMRMDHSSWIRVQ